MRVVVSQLANTSQKTPATVKNNVAEINTVPATANMAIFATYKTNEEAIEDVCYYIINNLSDIIQLPELFFIGDKAVTNNSQQLVQIEKLCKQLILQISAELRPFQYVCTSLVIEGNHQAVLISEHGLVATQQQLNVCQRYQWTKLGNELNIIELSLEQGTINVAMLTSDDAKLPEIVDLAATNNIHLLLVPFDIQAPCEVENNLLACAEKHRICVAAASREKSFTSDIASDLDLHSNKPSDDSANQNTNNQNKNKKKIKPQKSTGFIADLSSHSPQLIVKHQHGKITKALVHPIEACLNRGAFWR